jgi:DNA-directed RNA polymerase specialized sigma24 family protein
MIDSTSPPPPPDEPGGEHRPPSSKEELDRALVNCVLGKPDGCAQFYDRLCGRCLDKVQNTVRQKVSDVADYELEIYAQEALEDVTLLASQGKLAVDQSYTLYLVECCLNRIREDRRRKKGHEIPFSVANHDADASRSHTTTIFVNTLIAPGKRPETSAIERELLHRVGEQVGGLATGFRDVICRAREGLTYFEIASELGLAYATVKAQFWQAVEVLEQAIGNSGILSTPDIPRDLRGIRAPEDLAGIEELLHRLPANVAAAAGNLHLEGMTLDEVAESLGERRSTAEALVLHAYWTLRVATGKPFPKGCLILLPPHPHYDLHEVRFKHW